MMVVRILKGIIKILNKPVLPILNCDETESGVKIITCDHTINNILKRTTNNILG